MLIKWRELNIPNVLLVPVELHHQLEVLGIPDLDRLVLACRSNQLIIWRELGHIDVFLMSHYSQLGLIHNFHRLICRFALYKLFDVPNFNGVVLTCAHKLIAFPGRKTYAADILIVAFEQSDALDPLKLRSVGIVFPEPYLRIFGSRNNESNRCIKSAITFMRMKFINRYYNVFMSRIQLNRTIG